MTARLASFVVGGEPGAWAALGFTVADGTIALANGAIELDAGAAGPVALRVDTGVEPGVASPPEVDGITLLAGHAGAATEHANGCFELDHLVIMTPSIERTSAAIEQVLGLAQRRIRETATVRQAFHRFDERGCILELVERRDASHTSLWGVVVNTGDLDALCAAAGGLVGDPKPAVQPGRWIATARREAGLGCAVAFMTPELRSGDR